MTALSATACPPGVPAPRDSAHGVPALLNAFPCDLPIGVELGVMRALAAPPVTRLLMRTGGYERRGRERHAAVLGAIFVALQNGLDHPDSHAVYRRVRMAHARHNVPDELVLYAMACIVVGPIEWIDRYAWRALNADEQALWGAHWTGMAERIGLTDPPPSTDAWRAYLARQESRWFAYCDDNARLAHIMREIFACRVYAFARPAARLAFTALIPREVLPHVGWRRPNLSVRGLLESVLRCRATLARAFPPIRHTGRVLLEQLD